MYLVSTAAFTSTWLDVLFKPTTTDSQDHRVFDPQLVLPWWRETLRSRSSFSCSRTNPGVAHTNKRVIFLTSQIKVLLFMCVRIYHVLPSERRGRWGHLDGRGRNLLEEKERQRQSVYGRSQLAVPAVQEGHKSWAIASHKRKLVSRKVAVNTWPTIHARLAQTVSHSIYDDKDTTSLTNIWFIPLLPANPEHKSGSCAAVVFGKS